MRVDIPTLDADLTLAAGEPLMVDLSSGGHWFGHGFSHVQPLPLEQGAVDNPAFAVNNIQCPVWMCSRGRVLFADTRAPLQVAVNRGGDGLLRVCCPEESVRVRVFCGADLPAAQRAWLRAVGWPNRTPREAAFGEAWFCTWTQYPRCITQERVLDMARQIRARGYPCRTLLIDDRWERCFGELEFSRADFPDPRAMFAELKELGFESWLWVTPFVNQEAAGFGDLARRGVLVPRRDGDGAALLQWWGGTAGLVDVTGPRGREWYRSRLQGLLDLGAAGFKVDGGDHKYHPPAEQCAWHADPGASGYSDCLLALFESLVPNRCETRTAWLSQSRAILWREGGKDSHWGLDNGLKAMVTLGLHLGLLGYDLLIPDMVPGRVQTMNADDPLPTDELMVRWTEASAWFPFLQFSYLPWNYAKPTADAVKAYALAHQAVGGYMAQQARERRAPLLRPVWYDHPECLSLYTVADQFMLGRDLLAAPVLEAGVMRRDVRLPPGEWIDAWSGAAVTGHLVDWPSPCPGSPLFVRAHNPELLAVLREALGRIRRGTVPSGSTSATWQAGLNRDLNVTG